MICSSALYACLFDEETVRKKRKEKTKDMKKLKSGKLSIISHLSKLNQ